MEKITSFTPERCRWCEEIRQKYQIRANIAKKLKLKKTTEFENLSWFAKCPFHKSTDYYTGDRYKEKIEFNKHQIIVKWWTNYHFYKLTFDFITKTVSWNTNHIPSSFIPPNAFDFNALLEELLLSLSLKELEELEKLIDEIEQTKAKQYEELLEYITHREFTELKEPKEITIDGKKYTAIAVTQLTCQDKPITKYIQGLFEYKGKKYYKEERYVYELVTEEKENDNE